MSITHHTRTARRRSSATHDPRHRTPSIPASKVGAARRALAGLPEHPRTVPLTWATWQRVLRAIEDCQPVLAEYSFHSMHLWRGGDAIRLSRIGAFVVAGFTDEGGQTMIVSLPGAHASGPVAARLAALLAAGPVHFLSAPTVAALQPALLLAGLTTAPARDHEDYVYELAELAGMRGSRDKEASAFEREHAPQVRTGRLDEAWAWEHLQAAEAAWLRSKHPAGLPKGVRTEHDALASWPRDWRAAQLRVFALEVAGRPVGISVVEPMWNRTLMGVYFKADPSLGASTAYLRRAAARIAVRDFGADWLLNTQQDDGLPGLRSAKCSFRPVRLEAKWSVARPGTTGGLR